MYGSNSLHGVHCRAKTYPTNCPDCGANVFYFSCNHGSKVFFDSLGAKWLKHECDFETPSASPEEDFRKKCAYALHRAGIEIIGIRNLPRRSCVSIVIPDEQRYLAIRVLREYAIVTKSEIDKFNTIRLFVVPNGTNHSQKQKDSIEHSAKRSVKPIERCQSAVNKALNINIEIISTSNYQWQITANKQVIRRIKDLFYRHNSAARIEERRFGSEIEQIVISPAQFVYIADVIENHHAPATFSRKR